jgi:hypothetical protein
MKKVTFLLVTLLIGGMMLTGCKKPDPTPTPEPTPTPTTLTVVYKVDNTNGHLVMSDCFKLNVTYIGANGQEVTESGVALPWMKSIEVTSPFKAKMEGEYVYNENELPDQVVSGKQYGVGYYTGSSLNIEMLGSLGSASKESFLNLMAEHPDRLKFTMEKDF